MILILAPNVKVVAAVSSEQMSSKMPVMYTLCEYNSPLFCFILFSVYEYSGLHPRSACLINCPCCVKGLAIRVTGFLLRLVEKKLCW